MPYYEGLSCPVCFKAFTADEDIVVCPQCGLPHHRACWKSIGHCYKQDSHGTEQQWSRDRAQAHPHPHAHPHTERNGANLCPKCQFENTQYAEFCSRCGTQLNIEEWHSTYAEHDATVREHAPYHTHFATESYTSTESIDGVATDDLAAIVGGNTMYYMPRFRRMANGGSGGWNWSAFWFAPYWLFYRKQYLLGAIYLVMSLAMSIIGSAITLTLPVDVNTATMDVMSQAMQKHVLFYPSMALVYIYFGMMILLAIKGNAFYFSHCKKKVKSLKAKTPDLTTTELSTYGGVSVGMTVLFFAISYTILSVADPLLRYFLM